MWTARSIPKQEVKVTHRVAIDLSDRKLYAYENDTVVKTLNVVVAEGNDNVTGGCVGMMCTPTGDFNVWQKLPSQDMSGTLNLADGTVETWDVKDVGFVNYFSSGCAIHRIAGGYVADAVMPSIANGSHGCVGIGWDVAEWFYNWCNMGTSVHIQSVICNSVICNKYGMQWCDTHNAAYAMFGVHGRSLPGSNIAVSHSCNQAHSQYASGRLVFALGFC